MHRRMDGKTEKQGQSEKIHFSRARGPKKKNLQGDQVARMFYKEELQKTKQMVFTIEKTLKRKGYNLYVMQKDYGSARLKIGFINLTYLKKNEPTFS